MTLSIRRRGVRLIALATAVLTIVLVLKPDRQIDALAHLKQATECGQIGQPCVVAGRTYSVVLPKGDGPFPAVIFFHGSGGTGQRVIQDTALVEPILTRGYAVIAPTALEIQYRTGPGTGWVWDPQSYGWDDFAFTANMLEDVLDRFPVDPSRIVAAGHSRGGSFSWYLACADVDDRLRVFAPVAGTLLRDQLEVCASSDFDFHMFHSHGYSDAVIPFAGSGSSWSEPGYMGALEAVLRLGVEAGCQTNELIEADGYDQRSLSGCETGANISVIGYEAGHGIPVGWSDVMLDWFESLSAPG